MSIRAWQKEMFIRGASNFSTLLDHMPVSEDVKRGIERFTGLRNLEGNVLDLGCGPGRFLEFFASRARRVVGVDISRPFLDQAMRRVDLDKIELVEDDMQRFLRAAPIQFDAIFRLYTSLGYFPRAEELETLRIARAKTNRGAVMLIDSFNGEFFRKHEKFTRVTSAGDMMLHEEYLYDNQHSRIVCRWRFLTRSHPVPAVIAPEQLAWPAFNRLYAGIVLQEILFKLDSYDTESISGLVLSSGWKLEGFFRDLTGKRISSQAPTPERLVVVLRNE